MSSSSFPYNWDNVTNVIKKVYDKMNFNESTCDIYTMDYTYQSPTNISKVDLECVLQCTKFPQKQANGYMFQKNCSSIKKRNMKLGDCFQKKRGKNNHKCHMFNNYFLASSKQIKLSTRDYSFLIKQEYICD